MRAIFGGRRRRMFGRGDELGQYRSEVIERTTRIDALLATVAAEIDVLRRRAIEPNDVADRLEEHEDALDEESEGLRGMMAPEDLHGLHMEYEASLERALRGIMTVGRGCRITRLPHRPPDDEEPHTYYKRGHANVTHARMRMAEIADVLLLWEPGQPADASVSGRLERSRRR